MNYRPVAHIRPLRLGWTITFGEDSDGPGMPLAYEWPCWRPTRRMAENRANRWLARKEKSAARDRQTFTINGPGSA